MIGSLFPNAMQEQMREPSRQDPGLGGISHPYPRNAASANAQGFGAGLRDTANPVRAGRGMLDDPFSDYEARNRHKITTTSAVKAEPEDSDTECHLSRNERGFETRPRARRN